VSSGRRNRHTMTFSRVRSTLLNGSLQLGRPGRRQVRSSYLDFSTGMLRIKSRRPQLERRDRIGWRRLQSRMPRLRTLSGSCALLRLPTRPGIRLHRLRPDQLGLHICEQLTDRVDSPRSKDRIPAPCWWTSWIGVNKSSTPSTQAPFAPEKGFHSYKCVLTTLQSSSTSTACWCPRTSGVVPQTRRTP